MGFPRSLDGKESPCNAGDLGSIRGLGRSPGEGNCYPLQYSGLENSMDYIVHGIAKSQIQLSNFHFHFPWVWGFPGGASGKESTCWCRRPGLLPGSGRSPGGGHGNPLQYSCLENPMDRGALQVLVAPLSYKESDSTEATEHKHTLSEVGHSSRYFQDNSL